MSEINSDNEKELILAQWQTCVEMADSISGRRDTMNNLFVTLNLALITAASAIGDAKRIRLSIVGIIVSISWILFINNFKRLNEAKFKIINNMELRLPEQPFIEEWRMLKFNRYIKGTTLEIMMPIIFCSIHIYMIL